MQESKLFRLENISEILMGQLNATSITWQDNKQVFSHKEPDERIDGNGIASFGGLGLCTPPLWHNAHHAGEISPLLAEKGITSSLWMRSDNPTPVQLAEEARMLKNKTAVHLGWLLPMPLGWDEKKGKALEDSPAVAGFWMDSKVMAQYDIAFLAHLEKPIILDAQDVELSVYMRVLKSFRAIKKRPIIVNSPIFHPRDYEELVALQSMATLISCRAGSSIGGVYMPIFSHLRELNNKDNFWRWWQNGNVSDKYWQLFFAQQQIYKAYKAFNIIFKGRKIAGYDADIVILDPETLALKIIITGGKITYWQGEFSHNFSGLALKIG